MILGYEPLAMMMTECFEVVDNEIIPVASFNEENNICY